MDGTRLDPETVDNIAAGCVHAVRDTTYATLHTARRDRSYVVQDLASHNNSEDNFVIFSDQPCRLSSSPNAQPYISPLDKTFTLSGNSAPGSSIWQVAVSALIIRGYRQQSTSQCILITGKPSSPHPDFSHYAQLTKSSQQQQCPSLNLLRTFRFFPQSPTTQRSTGDPLPIGHALETLIQHEASRKAATALAPHRTGLAIELSCAPGSKSQYGTQVHAAICRCNARSLISSHLLTLLRPATARVVFRAC